MARAMRVVAKLVGGIQFAAGVAAMIFTFYIYAFQWVRDALAISPREAYLYMFMLVVFSVLSLVSGAVLYRGERG